MRRALLCAGLVFHALSLRADPPQDTVLPGDHVIPSQEKSRYIPGDQVIPHIDVVDVDINSMVAKAQAKMRETIAEKFGNAPAVPAKEEDVQAPQPIEPATKILPRKPKVRSRPREYEDEDIHVTHNGVRVIQKNLRYINSHSQATITLPSGSVALGTMKIGIEAGNEKRPLLVELDYTFLGPNDALVEMNGCRMWVYVEGNQTTARLYGSAHTITCRANSGKVFDLNIKAHLVDGEDEYLGIKGERVFRGKDIALMLDFLNGGLKAYGEAIAKFQTETKVTDGEHPIKAENVRGDENRYVMGKTLSGSMGKMMNWFVDYYQSLSPTVAVGTGRKVFLAVEGSVEIPSLFFGETVNLKEALEKVKRVNTTKGPSS